MTAAATTALVEALRRYRLLDSVQADEVSRTLLPLFPDPKALAGELIRRGWLTPYQVNQLLQGRGTELVLGSYVLLDKLGEGGMGAVFKARHWKLGKIVALKVIRAERLGKGDAVRRFRREIMAAAQLDHPHIVRALDAEEAGETLCLVLEYVEGIDLARLVKQRGPLPVLQACDYVRQAALALQHAHEKGLVHRDVKPSNLLLSGEPGASATGGQVKLLDLGLVRLSDPEAAGLSVGTQLTGKGVAMGTADYLAPEQAEESSSVDIRADLYSLGCTLYFLLSGRVPYPGGTFVQKALRHQREEPVPLERWRPDLPAAVVAVVCKLMAKRPEDRYQTPAEAADALANLLTTLGPPAAMEQTPMAAQAQATAEPSSTGALFADLIGDPPADRPARGPQQQQTGRWLLLKVVGGLLLGLVALVVFLLLPGRTGPTVPAPVVVTIRADQPWQDTGVEVSAGEAVTISAAGRWAAGPLRCSAEGLDKLPRDRAVLPEAPALCLLARVGDEAPFGLGVERTFQPAVSGRLFVQANDLDLEDLKDNLQLTIKGGRKAEGEAILPPPIPVQVAEAEVKQLAAREVDPQSDRDKLREELLAFVAKHGSTAQVVRAAELLRRLPSPLDKLRREDIPEYELKAAGDGDAEKAPPGLVAVLGHSRLKRWSGVAMLAYRPDGKRLASIGGDGLVVVWDAESGKQQLTLRAQGGSYLAVAYSRDGKRLAATGPGSTVKVWDADSGREQLILKGDTPPQQVCSLAFSPDGKRLASGSVIVEDPGKPGELKVWDLDKGQPVLDLSGHTSAVLSLAFSPDGKRLASGGPDQVVRVWDLATGQAERSLPAGDKGVKALDFSPDGRRLAAASYDAHLRFWDVASGKLSLDVNTHVGLFSMAFSPEDPSGARRVAVGGTNGSVTVWDAVSGKLVRSFAGLVGHVVGVAFSPDGKHVAAAAEGVRVWDVSTGQESLPVPGHAGAVKTVAVSPDGRWVASGSIDSTVKLWDAVGRTERLTLEDPLLKHRVTFSADARLVATGGSNDVRGWSLPEGKAGFTWKQGTADDQVVYVALSPDGKRLAIRSTKGTITVRDVALGEEVCSFETWRPGPVTFSPDGRRLAAVGDGNAVRLWAADTGQPLQSLAAGTQLTSAPVFSADGRRLGAGDLAATVWVWDLSVKGSKPLQLTGHGSAVSCVAFAPDGRTLVSAGGGQLLLWDAASGQRLRDWRLAGESSDVVFAADGRHLITGNANGTLYVIRLGPPATVVRPWEPPAHSPLDDLKREQIPVAELREAGNGDAARAPRELVAVLGDSRLRHWSDVTAVAYSPDGKRIASAADNGFVKVWSAATGEELLVLPQAEVASLAFHLDGRRLACGGHDGTLGVWDVETAKQLQGPLKEKGRLHSLAFSRDGKRLVAAVGSAVRMWSAEDWKPLWTDTGHTKPVYGVAISADGSRVASGSEDKTVRILDADNGKELHRFASPTDEVRSVSFSPDGKWLASADTRTIWIWEVATGRQLQKLDVTYGGRGQQVAFSPDGRWLAATAHNGTPLLYNTANWKQLLTFPTTGTTSLAFSPDSSRLVAGHGDRHNGGTIRIWEVPTGKEVPLSGGHEGPVGSLAVSRLPTGSVGLLASTSTGEGTRVWDAATGRRTLTVPGGGGRQGVAFTPDGNLAYINRKLLAVQVRNAGTGRELLTIDHRAGSLTLLAVSPDGQRLAMTSGDGFLQTSDLATGRAVWKQPAVESAGRETFGLAFSPDGRRLAATTGKETVMYSTADGRVLWTGGESLALAFSPDGKSLAVGEANGVLLHDSATGQTQSRFETGPSGRVTALAFSPDGDRLAMACESGRLLLCNRKGISQREWQFPSKVAGLAFAPDGGHLITGNANGTLYVLRLTGPPGH
jgi:WD40 repeat protein/tRNA A-37 threonylcarbamoyl transferase component Bud32